MAMDHTRSYNELMTIDSFYDRLKYLQLHGRVSELTFGESRYINQMLYSSREWRDTRKRVILRDNGCDLGHPDFPIMGKVFIHHLEPLTVEDVEERNPKIFDMNNLITVSFETHNAIHYGTDLQQQEWRPRTENDTIPWR